MRDAAAGVFTKDAARAGRETKRELLRGDEEDAPPPFVRIESAARFGVEIPLEYAYAAWGRLREPEAAAAEQATARRSQLRGFAGVRAEDIRALEGARLRAHAARRGELRLQEPARREGTARPVGTRPRRRRARRGAAPPLARRLPAARTPRARFRSCCSTSRSRRASAPRPGARLSCAASATRRTKRRRARVASASRTPRASEPRAGAAGAPLARGRLGRAQPLARRRGARAPRVETRPRPARGRRGVDARRKSSCACCR